MRMLALALPLLATLAACDNFPEVQATDSIEAYETYLKENPNSRWEIQATSRLEELYLENAHADGGLSGYDAYLERFPDGHLKETAMTEREEYLFKWATDEHSAEAWQQYLDDYPRAKKKRKSAALKGLEVAKYEPNLKLGPLKMERVNLAEDPEGPLNGWSFKMDVTNDGPEIISYLTYTIAYLDDEGTALARKDWPLVARFYPVPIEEERKVAIQPGETRDWYWTDGDMPDGWSGKVDIYATSIRLGLDPADEEAEKGK